MIQTEARSAPTKRMHTVCRMSMAPGTYIAYDVTLFTVE